MQIRIADGADLSAIQSLLGTNDLPVTDISKALIARFLVAEDASGLVIGIGGLEQLGSSTRAVALLAVVSMKTLLSGEGKVSLRQLPMGITRPNSATRRSRTNVRNGAGSGRSTVPRILRVQIGRDI
jgi:hypothetical protein